MCVSETFSLSNGVRQGGVLSTILFNLCVNNLHERLIDLGLRCHIGNTFASTVDYADDISLIASSISSLINMINKDFAVQFCIHFNLKKIKHLCFNVDDTRYIAVGIYGT